MEPTPAHLALRESCRGELVDSEVRRRCSQLRCYGQGEEYNWGFRIYRTTYTPGSDKGTEAIDWTLR
jgi:hypothetical protein